jgi:hypothetical protein
LSKLTIEKKEKPQMYEKPNLNCVGAAQDVILGVMPNGSDMDWTYLNGQDEFAFDGDDFERAMPRA